MHPSDQLKPLCHGRKWVGIGKGENEGWENGKTLDTPKTLYFGVHDMAGNAWEWCADRYAPYVGNTVSDPGAAKDARVVRGGCWANVSFHLRCADRNAFAPKTRNLYIGFRCARDP